MPLARGASQSDHRTEILNAFKIGHSRPKADAYRAQLFAFCIVGIRLFYFSKLIVILCGRIDSTSRERNVGA